MSGKEQALELLGGRRFAGAEVWCELCGAILEKDCNLYHPACAVCFSCADVVTNMLWKAHSGEWLTWQNPPRPKGYTKRKIGAQTRLAVWRRDNFRCVKCGSETDLTVDHVDPERKGGKTALSNFQTLCRICNCKKGTRTP